jgi:glucokinase
MSERRPAIGIDVGGTTIKFGIVDPAGKIIDRRQLPTGADGGPDRVLGTIASGTRDLLSAWPDAVSIGLGVPGVINDRGEISHPPNFPGWGVLPVAERLRPLVGTNLPIAVENDANVAALGESTAGSAQDDPTFLFITLGTGVGGCIISNNEIWRGATGGAGEAGHVSVDINGPLCKCGARGCIESYLGQRYMTAAAALRLERFPDSRLHAMVAAGAELEPRLIDEAADAGDSFAREFLEEMGRILGAGIASIMNLCDLHLVIVGGGLSSSEDHLLEPARQAMRSRLLKSIAPTAELRRAALSNDAGMIGAAMLGRYVVRRT